MFYHACTLNDITMIYFEITQSGIHDQVFKYFVNILECLFDPCIVYTLPL